MNRIILLLLLSFVVSACATAPPFDGSNANLSLSPETARNQMGETVIWGGSIIDSRNLSDHTQLEILAYPLRDNFYPEQDDEAVGRFIAEKAGYLETSEFAPGRMVSVKGRLLQAQNGKIGDASYLYPVVEVEEIKLWSEDEGRSRVQFHFGIGIFR